MKAKGVTPRAAEQPIDTSAAAWRCLIQMRGVFAEFETTLRRERQLEGIAKAKAKAAGVYAGKELPSSLPAEKVRELRDQSLKAVCNR